MIETITLPLEASSNAWRKTGILLLAGILLILAMFFSANPATAHVSHSSGQIEASKNPASAGKSHTSLSNAAEQCNSGLGSSHCSTSAYMNTRLVLKTYRISQIADFIAYADIPLINPAYAPPTPPPISSRF